MTITQPTTARTLHTADQLLRTTDLFARDADLLRHLEPTSAERSWYRLESTADLEVWLIGWPPGTGTGWHDHVGSRGAFRTVLGTLTEFTWTGAAPHARDLTEAQGRSFGAAHVHDVVNRSDSFAASIHAYAPSLQGMTKYEVRGNRLVSRGVERAGRW